MIKKIAFLFILFITILPFKSIADERYLIFNSTDDYINIRSSPNGKVYIEWILLLRFIISHKIM